MEGGDSYVWWHITTIMMISGSLFFHFPLAGRIPRFWGELLTWKKKKKN